MSMLKVMREENAIMGIWKMEESLTLLESMYDVRESEMMTYYTFRNDRRRKEWLTVRILLRELLGRDVEICYHVSGRPYLKDESFFISITHTIGFVGVRLAHHPVALDLEYYSKRVLHLIPRYVSVGELQYIHPDHEIEMALVLWSAKETLYKLFDINEVAFDEHLLVSELKYGDKGTFRGRVKKDGFEVEVKLRFEIIDELILVYC